MYKYFEHYEDFIFDCENNKKKIILLIQLFKCLYYYMKCIQIIENFRSKPTFI